MDTSDSLVVGFKRHLRLETTPAEAVYLVSDQGVTALSGSSIEKLAPLLDGTRSLAQVKREVSPELADADVGYLMARLCEANLIELRSPATSLRDLAGPREREHAAYWSLAGLDPDRVAASLGPVGITTLGCTDAAAVAAACRAAGLAVAEPDEEGQVLSLVLCDSYLDPALSSVNSAHLASGRPWLLAKPVGAELWIGPVFQPGHGPCWSCLAQRLEGSSHGELLAWRSLGGRGDAHPPHASAPAGPASAIAITVMEAAKWLAGLRGAEQEAIYILNTLSLCGQHHPVTRRPQCRACGVPDLVAARAREPVRPEVRAAVDSGNGQRALRLEQVLERFGHLADPVTGIVDELRRDPRCPQHLHAYLSGPNRAFTASGLDGLMAGLRSHSGGKGATDLEAKVGALCEGVERYCGTRSGDELTVRDSLRGLGDQAIHPNASMLFAERQFAERASWNAACAPFHRIPEPFDETAATDWTPVWSLLTGRQRLLPTAMLYYSPVRSAERAVFADSNGNAAGSCLEDAIMHGFFELVERDAVALWWYNRTRQPGVCLDSFDDPWIAMQPRIYRPLSRDVWLLDLTTDLGIPAMAAVSRRTDKAAEDITLGFGAHRDPRVAARRALTELAQLLTSVAQVSPDGTGYGVSDPYLRAWWTGATAQNQPYLAPDHAQPVRTAAGYGYTAAANLDLADICAAVSRAGMDILVLDQTRPDINMPVVKVIVPGLRHFWPRFAPGRLFDAPVSLGRLSRPTKYEELNPIPVYV